MRPLILLSSLAQGGAEQVTVDFARALARRGKPVPVCTLTDRCDGPPGEALARCGLVRYDLGARRLLDSGALQRFVSLVRRHRFDLVHAHGQDASILAHWARRFVPFRLVITRHVMEEPTDTVRRRLRAYLALRALRGADVVVAVSRAAANRLGILAPVQAEKIRVIANGIDLERFDAKREACSSSTVRDSLGLGENDLLVLFPAVLRRGKGHDTLLAAVPRVLRRFPDACFLLAGNGELRGEIEAAASVQGPSIRLLGDRDDVPELMSASDLMVLPSLGEALPTVAIEAAAAGRAIVASDVGGVPEVVEHGVTGYLVPPGDPAALSSAIANLLGDAQTRASFGAASRRKALADFAIDIQVTRTLEIWEELVEPRDHAA